MKHICADEFKGCNDDSILDAIDMAIGKSVEFCVVLEKNFPGNRCIREHRKWIASLKNYRSITELRLKNS